MTHHKTKVHKVALLTEEGLEDISQKEVRELTGAQTKIHKGILVGDNVNLDDCAMLCYRAQSLKRIILLLCEFSFANISEIKKKFEKEIDGKSFSEHFSEDKKIKIETIREGIHTFNSMDVQKIVSKHLRSQIKNDVDYSVWDNTLISFVKNSQFYFGIDLSGFDLAQREYKVFNHPACLKGTIGYAVVSLSSYDEKKTIVSCMSKSGIIAIEAALYASGKAVNYYRKNKFEFWTLTHFRNCDPEAYFKKIDEKFVQKKKNIFALHHDLRHISAGEKNAKIAGISKVIHFSRTAIDWLDIKFDEGEVDSLIIYPVGKEKKDVEEFFRLAKNIVSKKGNVIVVSLGKGYEQIAKDHGFSGVKKYDIKKGDNSILIQKFAF